MRVLVNSDVLYGNFLPGLPARVAKLAKTCAEHGHVLVLPETALLEVERYQADNVEKKRNAVTSACAVLQEIGVTVPPIDVITSVPKVDVRALFTAELSTTEFLKPTFADYEDANRRASLHLPPHHPGTKTDEMRDLVIWAGALRLARDDGHALLISVDKVHTGPLGDTEASQAKLERVETIEDALEYLEVRTSAGTAIEQILEPCWPDLRKAGVPVGDHPALRSVSHAHFLQGTGGLARATASIKIRAEGTDLVSADLEFEASDSDSGMLHLRNILVGTGKIPDVAVSTTRSPAAVDFEERLAALREIFGEQ